MARGNAGSRSAKSGNSRSGNSKLPDYSVTDPADIEEAVDVYLDAPVVKVDEIKFELDDLRAHLAVLAEAADTSPGHRPPGRIHEPQVPTFGGRSSFCQPWRVPCQTS